MGDSRAKPGSPEDPDAPPSRVVAQLPKVSVPPRPEPRLTPQVNPRIRPEAFRDPNDRATRRNMQAIDDASTRIVHGDPLANITRPPPPPEEDDFPAEQHTRAWSDVEGRIRAYNSVIPDESPSSASSPGSSPGSSRGSKSGASGSGVAARDGRVAAMRELYARGDTEGALALAADISDSLPPLALEHPESAVVEVAQDHSFDVSDPFGGLIPLEEDQAAMPTVLPPPVSSSQREEPDSIGSSERRLRQPLPVLEPTGPSCAAPGLSLTQRHSIPVLRQSLAEVSKLPIDHRAGFLLTLVDGMQTLEEILDICAMPADEALELIEKLEEMGVLAFE